MADRRCANQAPSPPSDAAPSLAVDDHSCQGEAQSHQQQHRHQHGHQEALGSCGHRSPGIIRAAGRGGRPGPSCPHTPW